MSMLSRFRRWYLSSVIRKTRIPFPLWNESVSELTFLRFLSNRELSRLRKLAGIFMHEKEFYAASEMQLTDKMIVQLSAQACLLILYRNLDDFDGCREIIVYPDTFIAEHEQIDEAGVVHLGNRTLEGEAWDRGPVILSWSDANPAQAHKRHKGSNVVLHEFAHKLDMLNGIANGMPVLNQDMKREDWTRIFKRAYSRLLREVENGRHASIDPYAVYSPAEFFAVVTEYFFMAPSHLNRYYPQVYDELAAYYRQSPLERQA